ncbi:ADP-ribose pyrophosphatase [Longilinea arvoryzae]|uniref:ADP-ribose pyrophosphatase n=1 Tax=Longilinea arvoryzae TaxID=360412 RepID=A0A0S7B7B7_9CHLR|nr:NUDIX domain-containing protein [Longilinea arvoryzae]GAP13260.1 ADP-ribose pyrophosphatase [Longilinea arvoryzae]
MVTLGAFAIIFTGQGEVLLSHRVDMDAWNLPGGGVEKGELPNAAVVREVKEETDLDVAVERLVGVYTHTNKDELIFTFLCRIVDGRLQLSNEADRHAYFAPEQIPVNTIPTQVEQVRDALLPGVQPIFRRITAPSIREILGVEKGRGVGTRNSAEKEGR